MANSKVRRGCLDSGLIDISENIVNERLSLNENGYIKYKVINDICYVTIWRVSFTENARGMGSDAAIISGLPKAKMQRIMWLPTSGSTAVAHSITIYANQTEIKTNQTSDTDSVIYFSFDYPVDY